MARIILSIMVTCALIAPLAPAGDKKPNPLSADEKKIFDLTNQERKKNDLPAYKLNAVLNKLARAHSENMVRQEKFDHKLDGKDVNDRVKESGYLSNKRGENIAFGEEGSTMAMIMKGWMDSEGHRKNILSPDYIEVGVGIALDKDGNIYCTQVFARPKK
jgi:uncharacterized protein YkwD